MHVFYYTLAFFPVCFETMNFYSFSAFECYNCHITRHNENVRHYNAEMLPADCIFSPVVPVCFYDEKHNASPVYVRVWGEEQLVEAFVKRDAVIENKRTRDNTLSCHKLFRCPSTGIKYYKVDDDLLGKLQAKIKHSSPCNSAWVRLVTLRNKILQNHDLLCEHYRNRMANDNACIDVDKLRSVMDWALQSLHQASPEAFKQYMQEKVLMYNIQAHSLSDEGKPMDRLISLRRPFWKFAIEKARDIFGVQDVETFKYNQVVTGKRQNIHFEHVPKRSNFMKYVIVLPRGNTWYHDEDDRAHSTISRMLWEAEYVSTHLDLADRFKAEILEADHGLIGNEELVDILGIPLQYHTRTESVEIAKYNSDSKKQETYKFVDGMALLRYIPFTVFVYLATHSVDEVRKALMLENAASLSEKMLDCGIAPEMVQEIRALNGLLNKLLSIAGKSNGIEQLSRNQLKKYPKAFYVLRVMYRIEKDILDWDGEECKDLWELKLLLCFLGWSFFCGFRSVDMGTLMSVSFRPSNTGHHNMVIYNPDGKPLFSSTHCKTVASDLKIVPISDFLQYWTEDYETSARTHLMNHKDHKGMWVTRTGCAVHAKVTGNKSHKASEFKYLFDLFHAYDPSMKDIQNYTDLRRIWFDGSSTEVSGSMKNLIANAQEHFKDDIQAYKKLKSDQEPDFLRTDLRMCNEEEIDRGFDVHFRSKSRVKYTDRVNPGAPWVIRSMEMVKAFVWDTANLT